MLLTLPKRPQSKHDSYGFHLTSPPSGITMRTAQLFLPVFYIKVYLLHNNICTKVSSLPYYILIMSQISSLLICYTRKPYSHITMKIASPKAITMLYCFLCRVCYQFLPFLKQISFIYFQREGREGKKRGRETAISCFSHPPGESRLGP